MKAVRSAGSLQWAKVGRVQLLRLWQLDGTNVYPQLAVFRVSNSDYLRFSQAPKKFMQFVNENNVFSKDVVVAGPWVTLSSLGQKKQPSDWVLIVIHGKQSTMIVGALPQLKTEATNSTW